MFRIYAILFLMLVCAPARAQNFWIQTAGSTQNDEALDISTDAAGNSYVTGYYSGIADFGNLPLLPCAGVTDIFLMKMDAAGEVIWVAGAGGTGPDRALSIKTDASGNSFITGYYYGTANFGSTSINSVNGTQDIFIAKYDTNGNLVWVKSAGGNGSDAGNGITVDNSGNVVVTGQFSETAMFTSLSLTSMIDPNTSLPSSDIFIAKYNSAGTVQWVQQGAAKYADKGIDIATDNLGNIYAAGQFSDTITFDNIHTNTILNAIYLVKFNASGVEQWFRKAGGSLSLVYGLASNTAGESFITGNFQGNLVFYGTSNFTLSHPDPYDIYIAKYDASGNLLWAQADGSESDVSSNNVSIDDSSNVFIIGNFNCRMKEYSDIYGEGTFNSIGFEDVFAAKYNTAGNWKWARHYGSRKPDNGTGISVKDYNKPMLTGSYQDKFLFTANATQFTFPSNFLPGATIDAASPVNFCGDNQYNVFKYISSLSGSDIFAGKFVDLTRQPLDYYKRTSGCDKSFVEVCINHDPFINSICDDDSLIICSGEILNAATNTSGANATYFSLSPGPAHTFLWSTGATSKMINVATSGLYWVQITSEDGCFISDDTIYVEVKPNPAAPAVTDDHGIGINADTLYEIILCAPDSAVLWASQQLPSHTYEWILQSSVNDTVVANETEMYILQVTDTFGCQNTTPVNVEIIEFPLIEAAIDIPLAINDTVHMCYPGNVFVNIYDSIANPTAQISCEIPNAIVNWTITPASFANTVCVDGEDGVFVPTQEGWYTIEAELIRESICGTDTNYLITTVYVDTLTPPPVSIQIIGNPNLCPGGSVVLYGQGASDYVWDLNFSAPADSLLILQPGFHSLYAQITGSNGCIGSDYETINIQPAQLPATTTNPGNGIICPNDSLAVEVDIPGAYTWYGPSLTNIGNTQTVYVTDPGFYYVVVNDTNGCVLVSNSVEATLYSTPEVIASPDAVICAGETVNLSVLSNAGGLVQWNPPLTGNALTQTVSSPGLYIVQITSCNITTQDSIVVIQGNPQADITPYGNITLCESDTLILNGTPGMSTYNWLPGNQTQPFITVSDSGSFSLMVTDTYGCIAYSDTVIVGTVPDVAPPVVTDTSVCLNESVNLIASATSTVTWYDAATGGNLLFTGSNFNSGALFSDTIFYAEANNGVCSTRVSAEVIIVPSSLPPFVYGDTLYCEGATIHIYTDSINGVTSSWWGPSYNGNSVHVIIPDAAITHSGYYFVMNADNRCNSDTVPYHISVVGNPEVDLGEDTALCEGQVLQIVLDPALNYLWNGTSTGNVFNVNASGTITVEAMNPNCTARDTIKVDFSNCADLATFNVFSPNGDGTNDFFTLNLEGIKSYTCKIYNRWGNLIYILSDGLFSWNGTNLDHQPVPEGVYYYILNAQDYLDIQYEDHGFIHLFR